MRRLEVFVYGAGKVGRGLGRELSRRGAKVTIHAARRGLPARLRGDVVVLAVRDRDLAPLAEELARAGLVPPRAVCVHVAGSQGPDALAALRPVCAGVAQMHPMIAFASPGHVPSLARGQLHVHGDAEAERVARRLGRLLGMSARTLPEMDKVLYHAAAGLVANGAAALAALGAELLVTAGVPREVAPLMLGPLLRSVAENVEALGFPDALTGPIRRGDAATLERQAALLRARLPALLPFYRESGRAQLPLARALGEASPDAFDRVAGALDAMGP